MTKQLATSLDSIESAALSIFTSLKRSGSALDRNQFCKNLDNLTTLVDSALGIKDRSKPRGTKATLTYIRNSVDSVSQGIKDRDLNVTETRSIFFTKIMPRVKTINDISSKIKNRASEQELVEKTANEAWSTATKGSKGSQLAEALEYAKEATEARQEALEKASQEIELSAIAAGSQKLRDYSVHSKKFLSPKGKEYKRILETGSCLPVQSPVFVSFSHGRLRETSVLDELGFKYSVVSSRDSDHADVALVLEDQILLQFSKRNALIYFENLVEQMRKNIRSSDDSKTCRQKRKQLKSLEQKQERLESQLRKGKLNKGTGATVQSLLDKTVAQVEETQADIAKLEENLKRKRHEITVLKREVFRKSTLLNSEGKPKVLLKPKAYEQYLGYILNQFHEKGHHYSMLSSQFETHSDIADIQIAWLVHSDVADVVRSLYGDTNIVTNWGFPWKQHV